MGSCDAWLLRVQALRRLVVHGFEHDHKSLQQVPVVGQVHLTSVLLAFVPIQPWFLHMDNRLNSVLLAERAEPIGVLSYKCTSLMLLQSSSMHDGRPLRAVDAPCSHIKATHGVLQYLSSVHGIMSHIFEVIDVHHDCRTFGLLRMEILLHKYLCLICA